MLTGPFDAEMPHYYVMISNIQNWIDHEQEILPWMDNNLPRGRDHHQGMVITLEEEKDAMLFMLRWA